MKKGLFVTIIIAFCVTLCGNDKISSSPLTFRRIDCPKNNQYKLLFFIESKKEKSNNFKVAVYSPGIAVLALKFKFRKGEMDVSSEIKITDGIFGATLQVFNVKLNKKISTQESIESIDFFGDKNENLVVEIISATYK